MVDSAQVNWVDQGLRVQWLAMRLVLGDKHADKQKQTPWRNVHTRIANLRKLGVPEHEAVTHGCSRKGPWTMSSSRAVHEAFSLEHLTLEGLTSLLHIWQTLTAKELNRPVRTRTPGGVGGAQPQG